MNEETLKTLLMLVWIAHFMAYGFCTWFPFRHQGAGYIPGGVGVFGGGLITLFLYQKLQWAPALVIALPFGLAAIIFVCFKGKDQRSEPSSPANHRPAGDGG